MSVTIALMVVLSGSVLLNIFLLSLHSKKEKKEGGAVPYSKTITSHVNTINRQLTKVSFTDPYHFNVTKSGRFARIESQQTGFHFISVPIVDIPKFALGMMEAYVYFNPELTNSNMTVSVSIYGVTRKQATSSQPL